MNTFWKNNPYADRPNFVNLGQYSYGDVNGNSHQYDLYALVGPTVIDFGAKYGPKDHEYESGSAHLLYSEYVFYVGRATGIAAARYFANFHKGGD